MGSLQIFWKRLSRPEVREECTTLIFYFFSRSSLPTATAYLYLLNNFSSKFGEACGDRCSLKIGSLRKSAYSNTYSYL